MLCWNMIWLQFVVTQINVSIISDDIRHTRCGYKSGSNMIVEILAKSDKLRVMMLDGTTRNQHST